MDPNLMTTLRRYCIKNDNLAAVFDQLGLEVLLEPSVTTESISLLTRKNKADIVEAIIGEIAEHRPEEDVLSELVAFISYIGEKEYFKEHNNHVMEPSNSRKNSKRIPRNDAHHRSHYDYVHNHTTANQKDYNSAQMPPVANHSNSSSSLQQNPKDPAPVFFLQNAKPSKTSPAPPIKDIKILKRGTEMNTIKPGLVVPPNSPTSENLSSEASTSPFKPSPSENVFFGSRQSHSWVPNIASTRNGMDLKT
jgi:hypothetical protein